jgi:hypothetical protein
MRKKQSRNTQKTPKEKSDKSKKTSQVRLTMKKRQELTKYLKSGEVSLRTQPN